ncbi:hypothetical protein ABBQ32_010750 [Trebouxia sp. C0010 RCD-2024]
MRVADSHRLSGEDQLDDFVAASSEHGDDDATLDDDEDDDLQLANVSEDQALQKVSGSSQSEIKHYISVQYPGVSKSLLRHDSADTENTLGRLKAGGYVRVMQGPHPHHFPKKRYTPTHRSAQPAPHQVAKIVAWAEKLAVQPGKVQHQQGKDGPWRKKAAEAVVMQCLHELKDWAGVSSTHLQLNFKILTTKRIKAVMMNKSGVDSHVDRLVKAGQLERRHWGPPATLQQHDAGISKVRCPNHISLAQLKAAYAEFKVNQLPGLVAAAAQTGDGAQGTAPPQAAQTDSSDASQHRQAPAASLVKQDLHTSATTGAVTGMAPPAYATQMDGPNDVLDAVATNAAAGVEELCRAGVAHRDDEGVLESGDKRDRPTLDAVDGAPAKKAKLGKPLSFLLASLFSGPHKWPGLLWLAQRCLVLATEGYGVFLHGLPLMVEEDKGPAAVQSARKCPSMISSTDSLLPHNQHTPPLVHQQSTTSAPLVPVEHNGCSTAEQLQYAAASAAQKNKFPQHAHQAQQAQQAPPAQRAQQASAAAAVPSSLHRFMFPAQGQANMPGDLQAPSHVHPFARMDPQQHQSAESEDMPEKAIPADATWLQVYLAACVHQRLDGFWHPQAQGPPQPGAACLGALPPALAQQDPYTGRWVPTFMPMNPLVIDQLAKPDRLSGQTPQPPLDPFLSHPALHDSQALANKQNPCTSQQLPLSEECGSSRPTADRMHENHPAQLISHPNRLDPRMQHPFNDAAMPSMHQQAAQQWHYHAQAVGSSMPSKPGPCLLTQTSIIDSCLPTAHSLPQYCHNGAGMQEVAHQQLWHYGTEARVEAGAPPERLGLQQAFPLYPPVQGVSSLHKELTEFAAMASATQAEQQCIDSAVEAVRRVVAVLWGQSRTVLFGSQATGLALPGSDLDIVVLGVSDNMANAAAGFTRNQRSCLGDLLEDLLDALTTAGMLKGKARIIDAKVPIIKCTLDYGSGLAADISLGAVNGAAAVKLVRQMAAAAPPLRVLVLTIKAMLKETMLNEVFTGGLSSYSIVNMVMTHLLCMGYQLPSLPGPVGNGPGFWGSLVPAPEQPEEDVGELLLSFLDHFGSSFNYALNAVSVGQGGVVMKKREWKQAERPWLLAVEDPQQLGRDIGSGTYNMRNVQHLFAAAAATLRECSHLHTEDQQWASVQADGASSSTDAHSWEARFPMLSELILVDTAVGRDAASCRKRQQQAKQAPHSNRLSVLASHKLLKHHLSLAPAPPPCGPPPPPCFHVGRKGRRKKPAVSLQRRNNGRIRGCRKRRA